MYVYALERERVPFVLQPAPFNEPPPRRRRRATPVRARRPPRPKSYRKVRSLCAWDLFGRSCLSQKFMDTLENARAPLPLLSFTASFSAKALAEYALCAFLLRQNQVVIFLHLLLRESRPNGKIK
jgi:hypothetical protein